MGKIRVKTFGDEEKEQKEQAKKEAKKEAKIAEGKSVAAAKKETKDEKIATSAEAPRSEEPKKAEPKKAKKEKFKKETARKRSTSYKETLALVDRNKIYSLKDALTLLPQLKRGKFDETVELHINTIEAGISGNVTLPHGTGKQTKVAVLDDALLSAIEKGKIDFAVLLATPQMMPKLAKVAKILGPKGLMPNPKNGTVTTNPEETLKKYAGGHMTYKTENKLPVLHVSVGKVSFGEKKLQENITTLLTTITSAKIRKVVLKSTMSPGIKIDFTS